MRRLTQPLLFANFRSRRNYSLLLDAARQETETLISIDFVGSEKRFEPIFSVETDVHSEVFAPLRRNTRAKILDFEGQQRARALVQMEFLAALDRVYVSPLPMFSRELLLDRYINEWFGFIEGLCESPGVAVFADTPHLPWDIAFSASLQSKGWKVTALQPSASNNHLALAEIRGSLIFEQIEPGDIAPKHLVSMKNTANLRINRSKEQNQFLKNPLKSGLKSRPLQKTLRGIVRFIITGPGIPYWKFSMSERVRFGAQWLKNALELRRWLKKNGTRTIPEGRYCYFALHYQPERTTIPEAGKFWVQSRAIEFLLNVLPSDFTILIGEHPRQIGFQAPDLRQLLFRTKDFYEHLARYDRVQFVHPTLESTDLITRSSLVSTCTGSSVWEGLISGKPGITFGWTWYSSNDAVLQAQTMKGCGERLQEMLRLEQQEIICSVQETIAQGQVFGIPIEFDLDNGLPLPEGFIVQESTEESAKLAARQMLNLLENRIRESKEAKADNSK